MAYVNSDVLVTTEWLAENLQTPGVHIVDATWHMPDSGRNARAEYQAQHIPGAVYFDIDEIADTNSSLPHMIPAPEKFASRVRRLGLGDGTKIVVYDNGLPSAFRVWWMFRLFGHNDVVILDGGLAKWLAEGRAVTDREELLQERHFTPRFQNQLLIDKGRLAANLNGGRKQVLDVRGSDRFKGEVPEPREGLRSGHIPGAKNLPFRGFFQEDGTFASAEIVSQKLIESGIDLKKPVVTSCGSGVTACVAAAALHMLGHREWSVYDGSWAEWGGDKELPVAV